MKKRFAVAGMAMMIASLVVTPAAQAAEPETTRVMKGTGRGDARALDIDVLGLVRLTLAAADGKFEMDTQGKGTSTSSGRAIAICNLVTGGSDPLACSGGDVAASAAPEGPESDKACTVPSLPLPVVSVEVACASSTSAAPGARPTGTHESSVAGVGIGLPLDIKELLKPVIGDPGGAPGVVDTVQETLATTLAPILQSAGATGATAPVDQLVDQLQVKLNDVLGTVTKLAAVKVLPAQVQVTSPEDEKATVSATSSVVSIGLLGATDPLVDGLIQLKITPSMANATYDGDSAKANCDAKAAVVDVKVANLLGDGNLLDVAPGLNLDTSKILPLGNDLVGVKVATATPPSVGDTCRAEARGLELSLLKALQGGIQVRVASTNAEIAGDVKVLSVAGAVDVPKNLPTTGGPTKMYLMLGVMLGSAAFGAFRLSRKVRQAA